METLFDGFMCIFFLQQYVGVEDFHSHAHVLCVGVEYCIVPVFLDNGEFHCCCNQISLIGGEVAAYHEADPVCIFILCSDVTESSMVCHCFNYRYFTSKYDS